MVRASSGERARPSELLCNHACSSSICCTSRPSAAEYVAACGATVHGTVRHASGWYAYPVRTVRGAQGQTALRLRYYVRRAGTWYRTEAPEAPGRACQHG